MRDCNSLDTGHVERLLAIITEACRLREFPPQSEDFFYPRTASAHSLELTGSINSLSNSGNGGYCGRGSPREMEKGRQTRYVRDGFLQN
jgi:ribosomal protein S19E (S16A)